MGNASILIFSENYFFPFSLDKKHLGFNTYFSVTIVFKKFFSPKCELGKFDFRVSDLYNIQILQYTWLKLNCLVTHC